jgi:hypothetical protein
MGNFTSYGIPYGYPENLPEIRTVGGGLYESLQLLQLEHSSNEMDWIPITPVQGYISKDIYTP